MAKIPDVDEHKCWNAQIPEVLDTRIPDVFKHKWYYDSRSRWVFSIENWLNAQISEVHGTF